MSSHILEIAGTSKHFNGITALNNFGCQVTKGEILGLLGPNGAGKTTLFNVLTGFIRPDTFGKYSFKGKDFSRLPAFKIARGGISRTFQDLRLIRQMSVLENVQLAMQNQPGENLFNVFFSPGSAKGHEEKNKDRALELLESTGMGSKAYDLANDLSYGQQKLLSLTCCLAAEAELILLDEPVAGIAPELMKEILKIITSLPVQGKTVIIIEHNMDVIMNICDRVIFMDSGRFVTEGTPQQVRENPDVIEAYLR